MPKRTISNTARKAHARAEADFATWLMMAKLGGFDDLPANAQAWLTGYRTRLERMPESGAKLATIQDIYTAYYASMGGTGEAPELARVVARSEAGKHDTKVVELKDVRRDQPAPRPTPPGRTLSPFLIFAGMVAALAAFKFSFGF
jgi:hypothetical protein